MAKQQPKTTDKTTTSGPSSKPSAQATGISFIFDRTNYIIMVVGVVVILVGFALMSGGATTDPNVFPEQELYSFRRITLAPIVVMLGFAIEIFAILKRPKL